MTPVLSAVGQASEFVRPSIDWHALAPEIVLVVTLVVLLFVDLLTDERSRWATSSVAGIGLLAALVPVITLAVDGADRFMFGGAYTVDATFTQTKAPAHAEALQTLRARKP